MANYIVVDDRVDQKCRGHRRLQHDDMVQIERDRQPRFYQTILVDRSCFISGMSQLLACDQRHNV